MRSSTRCWNASPPAATTPCGSRGSTPPRCTPARPRSRTAGQPRSRPPLYGVPFAVKDNIDVAGLPTTAACPRVRLLPRPSTPTSVRLLLDAGAIAVGKTNLDQFATGLIGTRSPYGAPESVFGGDLISGGSSSGSAVAVAAGRGRVRAGHRHRRLGTGARRAERDRRAQADPRAGQHGRGGARLPIAGLRVGVRDRPRRRRARSSRSSPPPTPPIRGPRESRSPTRRVEAGDSPAGSAWGCSGRPVPGSPIRGFVAAFEQVVAGVAGRAEPV